VLKRCHSKRERLLLLGRLFDALEYDFMAAYPESKPIFEEGAEKAIEKLFHLGI